MKLFRIAFCVAMFALTVGAFGQISPGDLVVDVPFAFSAAGEILPAGVDQLLTCLRRVLVESEVDAVDNLRSGHRVFRLE